MWVRSNLSETDSIIIAFTAYNSNGSKVNDFDFSSLSQSDQFSVILIKDLDNSWYTGGIAGAGEAFQEVIGYLASICARYKRVLCIGDSMGAYGAILYGAHLKADKIIAISPQTTVSARTCRIMGDTRFIAHFDQLGGVPEELSDVRNIIRSYPVRSLDVYVSKNDSTDVENARNIEGIENVHVQYIDYFDHWMAEEFKRYGVLRALIRNFLLDRGSFDAISFLEGERERFARILAAPNGQPLVQDDVHCENMNVDLSFDMQERLERGDLIFRTTVLGFSSPGFRTDYFYRSGDIVSFDKDIAYIPVRIPLRGQADGVNILRTEVCCKGRSLSNIGISPLVSRGDAGDASFSYGPDIENLLPVMKFPDGDLPLGHLPQRQGYLMSGPYLDLNAGSYIACIVLEDGFEFSGNVSIDVACDFGNAIAIREYLAGTNPVPSVLALPFALSKPARNVEIRLHAENWIRGRVEKVFAKRQDRAI